MSDYLDRRGMAIGPLLDEARIDRADIEDPRRQISLNAVATLFDSAARGLNDPAFGLNYARHFPIGGSGLIGHMLMSAPTVQQALCVVAHYATIHTTGMQVSFDVREGAGWFSLRWPPSFTARPAQYTAFSLGALVLRIRLAAGSDWRPASAAFQHRAPAAIAIYRQFFGTRLEFDQPQFAIEVDAAALAKSMPPVMQGLFDTMLDLGDRTLREQSTPSDIGSLVQTELARRLALEELFDLETVAAALGFTSRSMQWQLALEATTYEQILLLTRIVQAEQYLRETSHPMTAIAAMLGFSELSAFTRWANRQFGDTPTAVRQKLRGSLKP